MHWEPLGRRTLGAVGAMVLALSGTASACGGDDGNGPGPTVTTTTTEDTTTTTLTPEQEVEEAYLAYAEMGARLLETPDPDDPEIEKRTTGEAYGDLVDGLTTLRAANQRYELGPLYGHEVLAIDLNGGAAELSVCVIDDVRLLNADTGADIEEGVTTVEWTVTLIREDGSWLVSQVTEGEVKDGVEECL